MQKKIAVGCGKRNYGDEWIHIDGDRRFDHIIGSNVTLSHYDDNSVDVIYACHLIAYWDRKEVVELFKEWLRVLKPNGILRIATPCFETMASLYDEGKIYLEDILGPIFGKMEMGNQTIYHKTSWDCSSLEKTLREVGFKFTQTYDWTKTEHAHIDDHSQAFLNPKGDKINGTLISLNIEATK